MRRLRLSSTSQGGTEQLCGFAPCESSPVPSIIVMFTMYTSTI